MKLSNSVVSIIIVAAVLVFAYGLGLLIRQARTGSTPVRRAVEVNDAATRRTRPTAARTKDTPEERARLKEEKAKAIEKMSSLTEEQKEKFRSQVARQAGSRRGVKADANTPASPGQSTSTKPSTDKGNSEPGKAGPG